MRKDISDIKAVLDASGVRMIEATELFHVSRTTLYEWISSGQRPQSAYTKNHVIQVLDLLDRAVELGTLPVKDAKGCQRMFEIKAALRRAAVGK